MSITTMAAQKNFYVRPVKVCHSSGNLEISKNVDYVYKFEIVEDAWTAQHVSELQEYKAFFTKFFLYTNQENFDALRLSTIEKFRTMYSSSEKVFDQYYKIISEWNMRKGKKEKLHKKWMQRAIALQLLSPYIEPLSFGQVNDKMKILRDAVSTFTITIIEKNLCKNATQLWGDIVNEEIDIGEINRIRRNYQLSIDNIRKNDVEKLDPKLLTQLLWLMKKCPLIIRENENLEKIIRLCGDQKFILLSDGTNEKWMESYSLFRKLSDLSSKRGFYEKVIENFTVSIQGKDELSLLTAFGKNEEFPENVTMSHLMGMLNEPHYIDGEKEILSKPYIERQLFKNIIDFKYLERVQEHTIVILNCSNNFEKIKHKLHNYKLVNIDIVSKDKFEDGENIRQNVISTKSSFNDKFDNSNLLKKIYICSSKFTESNMQKIYTDNSEIHTFHYFKIADNGHLEWIQSKGDTSELENYKLSDKCFVHENVLWSSQLENNINLITSDPGMGKSQLMKNFKNKCPPNYWTVTIYPKDVHSFFKSFKLKQPSNYTNSLEEFIIHEKYGSLKQLEINFFEECLKQNRVLYIWDALDEIVNEYLDSVLDIILQLSKSGFVQWITSRRHLQTFLEKKLNVLSHSLTQFNETEQQVYIKQRLDSVSSISEIELTIQKIKSTFAIIEHVDILGIPLQIFMVTELFRQNNEKYLQRLDNTFLLTDLYRSFIEEKFNIFYENKIAYDLQNPHLKIRIDKEKETMLKHYEILALKLIYPEFVLKQLNISYQESIKNFSNENYAFVGIITEIQNNVPQFLHGSFAEYLVAIYLSKNLKNIPIDIFFDQKYNNVRFFFDMLLAENSPAHVAVLYKNFDLFKTYDDEILTRKDKGGRSALHLICSWGQRHPRTKIIRVNNTFVVVEVSGFNGKPETKEFLEAVTYLQNKNNNSEHDSLLGLTPLLYTRKTESLAVELKLLLSENTEYLQSITCNDRINILYYSTLLAYDDVIEVFSSQKLGNISHHEANFITIANRKSPLILASEGGHKKIIKHLVKSGSEINHANNDGFTPLYVASHNGHLETVKYLVQSGAEIDRPTNTGATPLGVASQKGNELIVEFLVKSGADINCADKNGCTALHDALFDGFDKIVECLVKSGAKVNRADNDGFTPLYVASQNGRLETVKYLVQSGAEIDRPMNTGATPLFIASEKGHELIVEFLVKSGADINCADKIGFTALHNASFSGHEKIVEYLVKSGAKINRANNDGFTPLHIASYNDHLETVKYLVQSGAEIDRSMNEGVTPLHIASEIGHELIVEFLVKSGADINCANKNGFTALRNASFNGHEKIVEYLVKSGAKINRADNDGFTPLYLASQNGHLETVKYLVQSGPEIDRSMNEGVTPLHIASERSHEFIVEFLVKSGANINRADKNGFTALHNASFNGHEKIVEYLVKSGAKINRADNDGFTPLYVASQNGHLETVKYLVQSGAEIDRPTNTGATSLGVVSQNGHELIVEFLVKSGADINCADKNGFTALRTASFNGHEKIVEYLVKSGAKINRADNDGFTPLYLASHNGHLETVKYLVQSGAEIDRPTNTGATPLGVASQKGNELIVEFLVKSGADINCAKKNGFTALCHASFNGHEKIVEYLVKSGAKINLADNDGFTPLYLASHNGHLETVKYLVKFGAEIDRATNTGTTPLSVASENGHEFIVEFLVKSGADINCADKNGFTALRNVSFNGHEKIVEYLVKSGAKINRADNDGFTPLYLASQNGHLETVKYLVQSGAEIDRRMNIGATPLYIASAKGHELVVELLVKSGADINSADKNCFTSLRNASLNGHEKIVEYLVKSGAKINRADNDGFTPLYVASQNGHLGTVKYLVQSGAEINRPTNTGTTPLSVASENGHELIVEFLVKSDADINRADKNGFTALRLACFNGHDKIVERLVKSGAEINRPDNDGLTPLDVASQKRHEIIAEFLVKSGSEINPAKNNIWPQEKD
ncbi:uncharacterized protein LOC135134828 [Zophobas morio]|uniref:uncharacterized protein LOC135134828 n=1 Tax=Zophobas morio TaxID=2755281 RepID=UPI003083ACD7